MLTTVNEPLLLQAAEAMVGHDATTKIILLYQMLEKTAKDGYELGKHDAERDIETRLDDVFDAGYEMGKEVSAQENYDDGFEDGSSFAKAEAAQHGNDAVNYDELDY